jgi:hypothetical protein
MRSKNGLIVSEPKQKAYQHWKDDTIGNLGKNDHTDGGVV